MSRAIKIITEKFFRANEQKNEQYSRVTLKIENGPKRRFLNNMKKGGTYAAFLFLKICSLKSRCIHSYVFHICYKTERYCPMSVQPPSVLTVTLEQPSCLEMSETLKEDCLMTSMASVRVFSRSLMMVSIRCKYVCRKGFSSSYDSPITACFLFIDSRIPTPQPPFQYLRDAQ